MIHHVYANQSNVGDWLSAQGIQTLLAPLPITEHLCDTPFVPETLRQLAAADGNDLIIIGGGGLFMDYFAPFWEGFRPLADRVPFVLWGAGYCDMKREPTHPPRALLGEIVRQSRLCVVRDQLTREHLSDCLIGAPVICPTVVAVPPSHGAQPLLLHVDHFDNVGPAIWERMVAVAESFAEQTGRRYRQTNNLIPAGHRGALAKTLGLYASADLVLTSRLHGCIIALAMGRPVLVVSGDYKVESFMNAAGLGEWVCDLDDIESLPARLEKLPQQIVPSAFIEEGRRQNRLVADQVRALITPSHSSKSVS